ncbi:7968_t:CDS:2, partial [Ambispora leptoticha]
NHQILKIVIIAVYVLRCKNDLGLVLPALFKDSLPRDSHCHFMAIAISNAIQLPVDLKNLPRSKPEKHVTVQRTSDGDDFKAGVYGALARKIRASTMFELSIGDNNNWSKWVQAQVLFWESRSGNKWNVFLMAMIHGSSWETH